MIEDLVREWFFQGDNTKRFTSNYTEAHHGMNLFTNLMRQNHEKVLDNFWKKVGCEEGITVDVIC